LKKKPASMLFRCPECKETFEFDKVEENEFVPCPVCGTDYFTVKRNGKVTLQNFEETQEPAILA
jgi:lysine biosynthesis protein LysW